MSKKIGLKNVDIGIISESGRKSDQIRSTAGISENQVCCCNSTFFTQHQQNHTLKV